MGPWTSGITSASSDYLLPQNSRWTTQPLQALRTDYHSPLAKLINIKLEIYTKTHLASRIQNLNTVSVDVVFAPNQICGKMVLFSKFYLPAALPGNATL